MDKQEQIAKLERMVEDHLERAKTSTDDETFRNHIRIATGLRAKIRELRKVSNR